MMLRRYNPAAVPSALLRLPRLSGAYLTLRNHDRGTLLCAAAAVLLGATGAWLLRVGGEEAARAGILWCSRHVLFLSIAVALALCILTARRRAATRALAARAWSAALPVPRGLMPVENWLIETRPAGIALAALSILYGIVMTAKLEPPQSRDATHLWLALAASVGCGVLGSCLVPNAKQIDLPPGSRYVPQRRRAAAPLHPSLRHLGSWPIRQSFAWLQPRVVARASMPVLLCIGMGASADAAILTLAAFAVFGFSCLLVSSLIAVSQAAGRWLLPLPLSRGRVLRQVAVRGLALLLAAAGAEAMLLDMQGAAAAASIEAGLSMWLASWLIAIGGSVLTVARRGRP